MRIHMNLSPVDLDYLAKECGYESYDDAYKDLTLERGLDALIALNPYCSREHFPTAESLLSALLNCPKDFPLISHAYKTLKNNFPRLQTSVEEATRNYNANKIYHEEWLKY